MNKIDRLRYLYELETLIENNGDAQEIKKLRAILGIVKHDGNGCYSDFNPTQYKQLRESGMLDKDIREVFGLSQSGLYKNKIKFGLMKG